LLISIEMSLMYYVAYHWSVVVGNFHMLEAEASLKEALEGHDPSVQEDLEAGQVPEEVEQAQVLPEPHLQPLYLQNDC
jgi:hypothetical protein